MMKKTLVYWGLLSLSLVGCKHLLPEEDLPEIKQVIEDVQVVGSPFVADGKSTVEFIVRLPVKTSDDRRKVVFTASGGAFEESGKAEATVAAKFENGALQAHAKLKTLRPNSAISVKIKPEQETQLQDYVVEKIVAATPSTAASLKLNPTGFGIGANFLDQIRVVGSLRNAGGGMVSLNTPVEFKDYVVQNTTDPTRTPAHGRFRNESLLSNDTSRVSTTYSTSQSQGAIIKIVATVKDGQRPPIADSIFLNVNH